jgi:peptidoglycan/xylan/chitin deacetylase (PgdA/CDA1 family)
MLDRQRAQCNLFADAAALVLVLAFIFGALACSRAGEPVSPPSMGSQAVLERLWTPTQVQATSGEVRRKRLRPPDHTPPTPTDPPATDAAPPPPAGSIRRVKPREDDRPVALTFDLCERADQSSGYDGGVVDVLRRERVPATFFAGGKWMRSHPERTMQLIADPLFEVGNHAWTHGNLRVMSGEKAWQQIAWAQQEYALLREDLAKRAATAGVSAAEIDRLPLRPTVFRFPYGVCSKEALLQANSLGLAAVQWDVISGDASPAATPQQLARTVATEVRPGSIVVFHANGNGRGTAQALPEIVQGLRGKGYRFVTVSELLRSGEPVAADECYELRRGDNRRYDKLFGEGTG